MSQFGLCVVASQPVCRGVRLHALATEQSLLRDAAAHLFPADQRNVRVPFGPNDEELCDIFDEAYNSVGRGQPFESTELNPLLSNLLQCCTSIVLWWGEDWREIPPTTDAGAFIRDVASQLSLPIGDVYAAWSCEMRSAHGS